MQDDFDIKNNAYFFQQCVKIEEIYDNEFSEEFFVLAPVDVNDLYNQN